MFVQIGDDDCESSDSGQADGREVRPTVDNLWNNSIVAANVNVKTEKATYNLDDFAHHLLGRLPVKNAESLSEESEDEGNEQMNEDEDEGEEEEGEEDGDEEDDGEEEDEEDDEDDGPNVTQREDTLSLVRSR